MDDVKMAPNVLRLDEDDDPMPAPNVGRNTEKKKRVKIREDSIQSQLLFQSRINGAPTGTRGPCGCGYKHWCDGVEKDYVLQFNGHDIGFDEEENLILCAENFVAKHEAEFDVFYTAPFVSSLADKLRKHKQMKKGHHSPSTPTISTDASANVQQYEISRPPSQTKNGMDIIYPDMEREAQVEREKEADEHFQKVKLDAKKDEEVRRTANEERERNEREKNIQLQDFLQRIATQAANRTASKRDPQKSHQVIIDGVATMVTFEEKEEIMRQRALEASGSGSADRKTVTRRVMPKGIQLSSSSDDEEEDEEGCNCVACMASKNAGFASTIRSEMAQLIVPPPSNITAKKIHPAHIIYLMNTKGVPYAEAWLFNFPDLDRDLAFQLLYSAKRLRSALGLSDVVGDGTTIRGSRKGASKLAESDYGSKGVRIGNEEEEEKEDLKNSILTQSRSRKEAITAISLNRELPTLRLKIQMPTTSFAVDANLCNTLQELCDHIRVTTTLEEDAVFALSSRGEKEITYTDYEATLEELGLKGKVVHVKFL